ncbi:flagellar hook-length control protein FliK [Pollutimonas thiosulfatoxidans]|uniref:Flagellar hook-length control protein-like C-terminal domain-containing protein n=1 Tax=Pollutimonas thiosulfatoxidans TaxID=2028345 RepID=A0A410G9G1_9BURK|nr:flagellar hook-length control protein FliK [Pollutimonas thiosulfatoxidans]QAA92953.1 hypothetical protein CKA81_03155 [Pollutimonas thiosulfatoxidans]
MSVGGPSPLGTLLVQRLDAVLGTTLSAQANIVSGARPDAVAQPGSAERAEAAKNETVRHPREAVERATAHTEQNARNAIDKARLEARNAALLLARGGPNTATTPSAPTTLGHAAKTILALLANYPDLTASVQGRQPLLDRGTQQGTAGRGAGSTAGNASTGAPAGSSSPAAGASRGAGAEAAQSGSNTAGATAGRAGSAAAAAVSGGVLPQGSGLVVAQLAAALSRAVQTSGMFYESHLANLAFGKQSVAQLLQEPQAQIGRPAGQAGNPGTASGNPGSATSQAGTAAATSGQAAPASAEAASAASTSGRGAEALGSQTGNAAAPASPGANPNTVIPGLDPQAHVLVRQQLEVLANQTFGWRGEAWPGAPIEWEVGRREPQDGEAADATDHWATRLTLNLPGLGQVQARLNLAGKQLVMHLVSPQSADLLDTHAEALRSRYSAQGLQLSQLSIVSEEDRDTSEPIPEAPAT